MQPLQATPAGLPKREARRKFESQHFVAVAILVATLGRAIWLYMREERLVDDLIDSFDKSHDHRLSTTELRELLATNGPKLDNKVVDALFGKIDDEHDGFDEEELRSVLKAISRMPHISERVKQAAQARRTLFLDVVVCLVTGLGMAYFIWELNALEERWHDSQLRGAYHINTRRENVERLSAELAEKNKQREDVQEGINRAMREEHIDAGDRHNITPALEHRLRKIEGQSEDLRQACDTEIERLQEEMEKSVRAATDAAKVAAMQQMQSFMRCFDKVPLPNQGPGSFSKAQPGFCDRVAFSENTLTFGAIDKGSGQLVLYEASSQNMLGSGMDSAYRCREVGTNREFALKVYSKSSPDRKYIIHNDLDSYRSPAVTHPLIVRYERIIEDRNHVFVVMELIDGKDLHDVFDEKGALPEDKARPIFKQIAEALQHMHDHGAVHCDIKAENVMIVGDAWAGTASIKLIDFGFSYFGKEATSPVRKACLNPLAAPEYVQNNEATPEPAVDLWRLGCTLIKILTGGKPFSRDCRKDLREREKGRFRRDFRYDNLSEGAKDLIAKLVVGNPKERLSAAGVLAHPWVRGVPLGTSPAQAAPSRRA